MTKPASTTKKPCKQHTPEFRHEALKLAERAGMNVQTQRNKMNPDQPHQLTAPEIWLLTDITEDSTLVDGFLAQIHCLPCAPLNEVQKRTYRTTS